MGNELKVEKQGISGLKVHRQGIRSTKDGEKLVVVLEGMIEEVKAGEYDIGDIVKALLSHKMGETEVGFSLFVEKKQ